MFFASSRLPMMLRRYSSHLASIFCLLSVILFAPSEAQAQTGENVLVVANTGAEGSLAIAQRYAAVRQLPQDHVLQIKTSVSEEISRPEYQRDIEQPISRWIAAGSRQDRILYIVLTHGIPLRIAGNSGANGTAASVDSELALLYRRMAGLPVPPNGPIKNPYYAGSTPARELKPFSHAAHDIYLVTRLDGFTVDDALALIDRGSAPGKDGLIVLDAPSPAQDLRTEWLQTAAKRLASQGIANAVVLDTTPQPVQPDGPVLGYSWWDSNQSSAAATRPTMTFVPGALASTFSSIDAHTFATPSSGWSPLVADLIRAGVTGTAGQIAEPTFGGAIRPDILFPAYVAGLNLAESFYAAMPYLSWQTVIVGDPLCAPFRTAAQTVNDLNVPLDPATELPSLFSARRLASMPGLGNSPALKLMVRAEARAARGDSAGAAQAYTEMLGSTETGVLRLASKTTAEGWRNMASAHQEEGRYLEANDFYRRLIADNRNDILALNNLAYNLATYLNQPHEALPLAQRAATLAPDHPFVMHTLGWIQHLLGNNEQALRLLEPVLLARQGDADVQLQLAMVYIDLGRHADAAEALQAARRLRPGIERRQDYMEAMRRIKPNPALMNKRDPR